MHDLAERLRVIHRIANENSDAARESQKAFYDLVNQQTMEFKEGDLVMLRNLASRPGHTAKFEPKYKGPYRVLRKLGEVDFEILNASNERQVVHHNRLKHFLVKQSDKIETTGNQLEPIQPATTTTTTTTTTPKSPAQQLASKQRRGRPPKIAQLIPPAEVQNSSSQQPVITRSGRVSRPTHFFNYNCK